MKHSQPIKRWTYLSFEMHKFYEHTDHNILQNFNTQLTEEFYIVVRQAMQYTANIIWMPQAFTSEICEISGRNWDSPWKVEWARLCDCGRLQSWKLGKGQQQKIGTKERGSNMSQTSLTEKKKVLFRRTLEYKDRVWQAKASNISPSQKKYSLRKKHFSN